MFPFVGGVPTQDALFADHTIQSQGSAYVNVEGDKVRPSQDDFAGGHGLHDSCNCGVSQHNKETWFMNKCLSHMYGIYIQATNAQHHKHMQLVE